MTASKFPIAMKRNFHIKGFNTANDNATASSYGFIYERQGFEQGELTGTYSYFADGTMYSIKDTDGNSRIYIGPFTLVKTLM